MMKKMEKEFILFLKMQNMKVNFYMVKGIYIDNNDNHYEGEFYDNKKEGKGILKEKNGHIIESKWKNGFPIDENKKISIEYIIQKLHPKVKQLIDNNICTKFISTTTNNNQNYHCHILFET